MNEAIMKVKQENEHIKARTDSKAELIEPIDFSFKDLMKFEEINENHPRHPPNRVPKKIAEKYASLGLKLGYNALNDVVGIREWCELSFAFPDQISSIDLSFNCLSTIPIELLKFPGLKTIYIHGNKIADLSEIDKLSKLKHLTSFTIHGNPVETLMGFRHYILTKLPNLKHLNFSGISKADRQTATVWIKSNNKPTKVESKVEEKPKKKIEEQ